MKLAELVLIILLLGAGRVVLLLKVPLRRCTWCKGTMRARKHRTYGRVGACPHCHLGKQIRLGASTVHRWRQSVRAELRARREEQP